MKKLGINKPEIAFNIFSSSYVMAAITSKAVSTLYSELSGEIPSKVTYWLKTNNSKKLVHALQSSSNEDIRAITSNLIEGKQPLSSGIGGYIRGYCMEAADGYEQSNSVLLAFENLEHKYRDKVDLYPFSSVINSIHGIMLAESDKVFSEKSDIGSSEDITLIDFVNSRRESTIEEMLFVSLASLDIDACCSAFPSNEIAMLLPVVFPEVKAHPKGYSLLSGNRKLANFLYSVFSETTDKPTLKKMFGSGYEDESIVRRLKNKISTLDDYYSMIDQWKSGYLELNIIQNVKSIQQPEGELLFLVLFIASKICDIVFSELPADSDLNECCSRFTSNYYKYWRQELDRRNLVVGKGRKWDQSHIERLIRDSIIWV